MINQVGKRLKRKAFTMVEMVMVIVILGIVGMIGTDIIIKMYQGYIKSKIVNDLQQKTELLLEQITKRLQYRVKATTIGRSTTNNSYMALNHPDIGGIAADGPDMIEWIGYDYDSYIGSSNGAGYSTPGWSGFMDVDSPQTTRTSLFTPGSNLAYMRGTVSALSYGTMDSDTAFAAGGNHPIMLPKGYHNSDLGVYGWDIPAIGGTDNNATFIVRTNIAGGDTTHLICNDKGPRTVFEQYYLAWSAYGLVPVGDDNDDFNLTLRYDYQPWAGDNYKDDARSEVLAEHVSTFRVMQVGDSIRVKICVRDENLTGTAYGFCKEKAIF